jgi:endonuclease/exonuclease/phosphatase family metal-dependent hydrolase
MDVVMGQFTVGTYNVHHAALDVEPDIWDRRRSGVVARIRAADPAVIGLQECGPEQHADIAAELSGYEWCGLADDPRTGENNPIGVRSGLSLVDTETMWLSESGDRGSVGWDAAYTRVLTSARVRDPRSGREFLVFNTHFDHIGTRARVESANLLRERVDALPPGMPAVAMGDFNTGPDRAAYERLVNDDFRRSLRDARSAAEQTCGPETTLSDFAELRPDRHLDHVFVTSEFTVDRYTVDATTVNGRYPSDHLPVFVDLAYASSEPGSE